MFRICLWIFPESDYDAWCELVASPEVMSYQEYLTLVSAIQADQEHSGREVVRVHFTVAEMKQELETRGIPNTPDGRAAITAFKA